MNDMDIRTCDRIKLKKSFNIYKLIFFNYTTKSLHSLSNDLKMHHRKRLKLSF